MSIIPVGNRKDQVNQGPLKNQSILDSVLFQKIGQGANALAPDRAKPKPDQQAPPNDVDRAMGSGGLDHGGMANQLEQDRNPPPQNQQPSIAPAGAPADQFIGPAPIDESQQQGENPYEAEVQRIRQYIGYQNYGLDLNPSSDGSLEVKIIPPPGQPVDIGGLMTGLKQVTQGEWKGESSPAQSTGGPVVLRYIPQSLGTQKVEKSGR